MIQSVPSLSHLPPGANDADAERALVQACLTGDTAAWKQLYDKHFDMVSRLARSIGVHEAEADDLCQEIFVLVHRHLAKFRGEARLSTWIYKLTVRESIRFAKRRRWRKTMTDLFARERPHQSASSAWWEQPLSRQRYLQQLLARLSPERRMALVLFEVEGMDVGAIARLMNCKDNTVWTRIHRGRADLEKIMKEESFEA